MNSDDVVPEHMKSTINFKIIIAIVVVTYSVHAASGILLETDQEDFLFSMVPIFSTFAVGIISFVVAKRYGNSWRVFYKSYIFLGIAFVSLAVGEIIYYTLDQVLELQAYPSTADLFYGLFHTFTIIHLATNIHHFAKNTPAIKKIIPIIITMSIILGYIALTSNTTHEFGFDFQYGLIFVSFNAVTVSLAIFGVMMFRLSILGTIWLVLLLGILSLALGDIWYYYLELTGGFDFAHPVNVLWDAGYWIIFYALYSHTKGFEMSTKSKFNLNSHFRGFCSRLLSNNSSQKNMERIPVVSDPKTSYISWKGISIIFFISIGIFISFNTLDENQVSIFVFLASAILSCSVAVAGFYISKQYWGSTVFGRSYLALGLGYLSYVIAEITYYSLEMLGIEPYPSVADVFFFMLYPLVITHLVLNIRYSLKKLSSFQKAWLPAIPVIFIMVYAVISFEELKEPHFDFFYGIIFVAASSFTFSLSLLGASIFRQSELGIAWLLLTIGILVNALSDVWYYHLEIFGHFSDTHVVNVLWHLSNMIMVYALYNHRFRE